MNEFLFRILNTFAGRFDFLDSLIYFIAQPLALFVVLALGGYAYLEISKQKNTEERSVLLFNWMLVFGSALLAWFVGGFIKDFFATPRPFLELKDVNLLFPHGGRDSFPSGHAAFLSALASGVYFFHDAKRARHAKRIAWLLGVCAILVGLARIAVGIHWPFDIFGGIILGSVVAFGVFKVRKYFK